MTSDRDTRLATEEVALRCFLVQCGQAHHVASVVMLKGERRHTLLEDRTITNFIPELTRMHLHSILLNLR